MGDFVTAVTSEITVAKLLGQLTPIAGLVVTGIIVGFTYLLLRRSIKGIGRGKPNI